MSTKTFDDSHYDVALGEASPELRDMLALSYDGGDPWGSVIGFAVAVNDVAYVIGADTDPTYSPSPLMDDTVEALCGSDEYPTCWVAEAVREGHVGADDLSRAIPVLSVWLDAIREAGLDY